MYRKTKLQETTKALGPDHIGCQSVSTCPQANLTSRKGGDNAGITLSLNNKIMALQPATSSLFCKLGACQCLTTLA